MSDTVKVIIEIPKEVYRASRIIDVKFEDVIQIPLEVLANGTPLDSVKAEIADQYANTLHTYPEYADGLVCASQIIDRHIGKAESEDK